MTASAEPTREDMQRVLARQKAAQVAEGPPSAELRAARLDRCIDLLIDHAEAIAEAIKIGRAHV